MLALLKLGFGGHRTDVEYNLEVKVSWNRSKQEDTSDDNEPEDAYSNELSGDENRLAQNGAERQKEQELNSLASVVTSTGVEE